MAEETRRGRQRHTDLPQVWHPGGPDSSHHQILGEDKSVNEQKMKKNHLFKQKGGFSVVFSSFLSLKFLLNIFLSAALLR